ncbi:hypothetical protein MKW94_010814 [Papaver nudicaule]|uniref:Polygalacturonase n=1 Tax=Papaver nudicaule TaxID=74823 RepID=A0AA41VMZ3_PAPNU|nr:hypothetical protein [Papaver nudicaule]
MALLLVFIITLLSITKSDSSTPAAHVFSVTDYGAVGDGNTYDTQQIQAAIDACHAAGGGTVSFPKKIFLVGTIFLKSGVQLKFNDSTILGGTKMEDYPTDPHRWFVVLAENATDVGIIGDLGTIDGQGEKYIEKLDEKSSVMKSWNTTGVCHGDRCRPRLVGFFDCKNVTVNGMILRIPAISNLHIVRCENTFLGDSILESHFYIPHNHGILIEDSNNTFINNTLVDNGGNAITLKTLKGPIFNLRVTESELITKLSAIKFGSGSRFDFNGIIFDNINVYDSHRGITMQLREGGMASDITFSNMNINLDYKGGGKAEWTRAEPIYIVSKSRISNLRFINITSHSEKGVVLSGGSRHEGVLRNVKLVNVNLTFYNTNLTDNAELDNESCGCNQNKQPSAGIRLEYIDGLLIENMLMRWVRSGSNSESAWKNFNTFDFRPSTVNNVSIHSFSSSLD